MLPKCSIVCSTYGRWWLLEEMVACVLWQDYAGELELVVVNDAPCTLRLSDGATLPPRRTVQFVNLDTPAPCNPWKRDLGTSVATGEWCTYYDDDDIMLPHRFTQQVETVQRTGADWLAAHVAAVWQDRAFLELTANFFFCGHLWRRSMMPAIDPATPKWDDVSASERLQESGARVHKIDQRNAAPQDIVHVYRWGNGDCHHSGIPGDTSARDKERYFQAACRAHPRWKTGLVDIVPRMRYPYCELWRSFLAKNWAGFAAKHQGNA